MSRKRIVLCQEKTNDTVPLRQLANYHFGQGHHRLVHLKFKAPSPPRVLTPATTIRQTLTAAPSLPGHRRFIREYEATLRTIQQEAQFSDLLLIEDTTFHLLTKQYKAQPSVCSLRLACPVFVVPRGEERVEQIILVDDGEAATYQAIKYLTCLLPGLCLATPTTLLIARNQDRGASVQDEKRWISYLKLHFGQLAVHRVDEKSIHTLPTVIDYTKNALIMRPSCPLPARLREGLAPLRQFDMIL